MRPIVGRLGASGERWCGTRRRSRYSADIEATDLPSLFASIGIDRDYSELDLEELSIDVQGWNSEHPIFERVLRELRPDVVVELGAWKGASLLHMHALTRELGLATSFVCVDTWLGTAHHWISPKYRPMLRLRAGYPSLFPQFVANVLSRDALNDVYPLPMTTVAAAGVLSHLGIVADVVYVDAGHEEEEVRADLENYFELLRPGGVMFGDDYHPNVPGVIRAVDRFCAERSLERVLDQKKWLFRKPRASGLLR